jgi:hypothetical protein
MHKAESQTIHAIKRAEQRYNLCLYPTDIKEIIKMIKQWKIQEYEKEKAKDYVFNLKYDFGEKQNSEPDIDLNVQLIEQQSNRISLFKLLYRDTYMKVVYDNKRHTLATILPLEPKTTIISLSEN